MELRAFKVKFDVEPGVSINLAVEISKNIQDSEETYSKDARKNNKDIVVSSSNKIDKKLNVEVREASSTFPHAIKGVTSHKRLSNILRFKYYTDEVSEGLDYMYTTYHKRHSVSKSTPKFHETFYLYIHSKESGILFTTCKRAVKVNRLLKDEIKTLIKLKSATEIKFNKSIFEKVLQKILTKNPDNIVEELKYAGASIEDQSMGKCYINLNVEQKKSYKEFRDFEKKFTKFELQKIVFTTKLTGVVTKQKKGKEVKKNIEKIITIMIQSSQKCPLKIGLNMAHTWYEQIFKWFGSVLIEVSD